MHSARTPDDVIFGEDLSELDRAPRRLPAAPPAARARGADRARRTSRRSARTGASARRLRAAPASCWTRWTEHWETRGRPRAALMERFQPKLGLRRGGRGRRDQVPRERHDDRGRRRHPDPRRRRGGRARAAFGCREGICHTCIGRAEVRQGSRPAKREVYGTEGETIRDVHQRARGPRRNRPVTAKENAHDHHRDREPAGHAEPGADRAARPGVRRDPRRGLRRPRRPRPRATSPT